MSETRPVRSSEQLDGSRLAAYLRERLPLPADEMVIEQFPGGHSNLTYLLRFGETELVLRRPPFGPVPARAHDMAREYRVLAAVHPVFALAPQPLLLCEDTSVIGSIFYVMERRRGLIIRENEPAGFTPALRQRISESVIDTLADLHAVTPAASIGKPAGFVARQVQGWTERWHGSKTSEVTEMDHLAAWLAERLPHDSAQPAIVHGDYKLDNVMLDERDLARVTGVFDWEMTAFGDPLVDVGILLCYWVYAFPLPGPGWFTRDEILERYAARSGRDVSNIRFYEVFALFKLAVVIQQIYARYHRGQTDDPRFASLGQRVHDVARVATSISSAG
jgi:aminoglycoside phosphotransferase (APT) family kinase protein